MKKRFILNIRLFIGTALIMVLTMPGVCSANEASKLAVLPFEIISSDNISYIEQGAISMMHSRLAWKGEVEVIPQHIIEDRMKKAGKDNIDKTVQSVSSDTKADYVFAGTITQFSNAFSIDTRIYDINNRQFMVFSEQSNVIDDVIPILNTMAAKINKKVFNRTTIDYDKLAKEEKQRLEKWRHQNPEKMMPQVPTAEPGEKSSWWKVWQYL